MSRWVDRLEEELLDVGYGPRARARRVRRVAVPALAVAAVTAFGALAFANAGADRELPAAATVACLPTTRTPATTSAPVAPQLLGLLRPLREAAPHGQTPADTDCAEHAGLPGGPANEGAARLVAPGVGRGGIYLVPVEHWVRAQMLAPNTAAEARRRFNQPGACLTTVGGLPDFDPVGQCFSVEQIADGQAVASTEITAQAATALARFGMPEKLQRDSFISMIVPDGVAMVELRYQDGRSTRERVTNNVVIAHVPRSAPQAIPDTTVWYDARGRRCDRLCT